MGTQLALPAVSFAQTDAPRTRVLAELTAMRIPEPHAHILARAAMRGAEFAWLDWGAAADMDGSPHWQVTRVPPRHHEALTAAPRTRRVAWTGGSSPWADEHACWLVTPHPALVPRSSSYSEAVDGSWAYRDEQPRPLRAIYLALRSDDGVSLAQGVEWSRGGTVEPVAAAWAEETSPAALCDFVRLVIGRDAWKRALAADKAATNAYARSGAPLDGPGDTLLETVCAAIRAAVPLTVTLGDAIEAARKTRDAK